MERQKHPEQKKSNDNLKKAARLSGIGIQMGVTIYLGHLLGTWLDVRYQTSFWEITLTLTAIFLSLYSVILQVNRLNK